MKFTLILAMIAFSATAFADITLMRDARPVDGDLKVLKITKENSRHSSKVTLRTAFVSRMGGTTSDTTETIGVNMDCKVTFLGGILNTVVCTDDRRPVDGPLTQVTVTNTRIGYEATLKTVYVSRMNGADIVKKTTLAVGLKKI